MHLHMCCLGRKARAAQDYDATNKDYAESVDALQRAIAVLKKQSHDRKQASMVQVAALKELHLIPAAAKKTLDLFLTQAGVGDDPHRLGPGVEVPPISVVPHAR